ncbi:MAG: hypothetical protein KQI35_02815 [Bacteroidetes bacterium]|nr:hypothetical protein [Bacteroidota bacterium]
MATKALSYILIVSALILLIAARCSHNNNSIKGVKITTYYDSCETADVYFGDQITIGDPNDRFMISLPYSWDIRETYTDTVYGMFAANFLSIPVELQERMALMVTGYETEMSGDDYFLNELKTLKKDDAVELMETGMVMIDERNCHWIMFHNSGEHKIFHLVVYVKNEKTNEIYILQSMTYDTENYKDRLCNLKRLVRSFEFVK